MVRHGGAPARAALVHFIGCLIAQALVRPFGIVELKAICQSDGEFAKRGVATQVDVLVLDCAPWSLLKTSGAPYSRSASASASTQNIASMVLLSRQLNTLQLYQSRHANPRAKLV